MKRSYDEVLSSYDTAYYERIHTWSSGEKYRQELESLFQQLNLNAEDAVLDIGCGTGNLIQLVTEKFGCFAIGIDFPSAWVQACRIPMAVRGDATRLPFKSESFDCIFLVHVIGHLPYPMEALKECHRVLRPRGHLGLITPNRYFIYWMRPLNRLGFIRYLPDPTVLRYYTKKSLYNTVTFASFRILRLFPFGALPTLLRFFERTKLDLLNSFRERLLCVAEKI